MIKKITVDNLNDIVFINCSYNICKCKSNKLIALCLFLNLS